MGKTEQKTPTKTQAKDIRSFFKKQDTGAGKESPAILKNEKVVSGVIAGASPAVGKPPAPQQQAAPPKPAPPKHPEAPVQAKRPAKKSKVVIDDDDDDDVVMVQQPSAKKETKRGGASSGGVASSGGRSGRAPSAKKRRRVISEEDDNDAVVVDSSSSDDDFVGNDGVGSSEGDDEDFAESSDGDAEEGGGKRKKPARKAAKAGKLAGKKRDRSPAVKVSAPSPQAIRANAPVGKHAEPTPGAKKAPRSSGVDAAAGTGAGAAAATGSGKKPAKKGPAVFSMDPKAEAAIMAVSQAAEKLPPEAQVNFSLMPEGGEAAGNDATEPPNYRRKEMPRGHPDCLTGRTFVITGVLDSLMRPDAEDLIKRHGGKVTQSVSGRTAFLLAGHNCGRSKYRAAKQHNTKVIDEDGLFALILSSAPFMLQDAPPAPPPPPPKTSTGVAAGPRPQADSHHPAPHTLAATSFFGSKADPAAGVGAGYSGARGSAAAGPAAPGLPAAAGGAELNQLWVDKYKPRSSAELVGNNTLVANLKQWLQSWEEVHLRGAAAPTAKGGGSKPKDLSKKAALLSGPPGIGKTSSAHIIAREAGFEVVEMNASDTRNKSTKVSEGIAGKQSNVIKEMVSNTTLPMGLGASGGPRKQLLIMDEVDGMSGGDRGGIQDLIDNIKRSKIPIICICNDKYHQKLRSLRNYCMELEYRKPTVQQISKRMSEICQKEGLQVNQATMDALVTGAGGDLRLILGQLQMVRLRSQSLSYDEARGKMGTSKDTDMSPFECARRLLEPSSALLSMGERMELVFADIDLVPLLLQENYVNHRPTIAADPASRLRALAKASDSISMGDVVNNTLRRTQNWGLMPFAAVMSSLLPAAYMRGPRETFGLYPNEMNFPRFTAWLGNYSTGNKQRRLLGELSTTMAASGRVSSSRSAVRLEYASALRHLLARPLAREQEAAVPGVVELMHEYCIDREQMDFILDVTSFKSKAAWAEDPYKEVPTKVKSAFTRSLNSTAPAARCNAQVEEVKLGRGAGRSKAKGRKAAAEDDEEDALGGEGPEAEQETAAIQPGQEADDDEDVDPATLARRLAKDGVVIQLQDEGKGIKGKKTAGGGRGGGRGSAAGKAAGAGRGRGAGGAKAGGKK